MPIRWVCFASLLLSAGTAVRGEGVKSIPQGDKEPLLCLQAGGPTAFITGLAFSPDGKTLYAAGFDKVVRVWTLNTTANRFVLDQTAYRVPIGPGLEGGALNALALSSDGTWLAAAGLGLTRQGSGFRMLGWTLPVIGGLDREMRRDQGMIYVFNTKDGSVRVLRGHTGPVSALAFAPMRARVPPLLVSAAREWDEKNETYNRAVLLWDLDKAAYVAGYHFPDQQSKPALAVQATGEQWRQLRVAIALEDQVFRVWDVGSGEFLTGDEAAKNNTTAFLADPARVLTGSANLLQVWNLRGRQANVEKQIPFPATKGVAYYPRALALCGQVANLPHAAAAPDKLDHAAVVVRRVTQAGVDDWLYLLDLNPSKFGAVKSRVSLGQGGGNLPVLAAAPRGQFLAVAGYADHMIRIYSIPALLAGQNEPLQALRSAGVTMRQVRFVRKEMQTGLLLSESEPGLQGAEKGQVANLPHPADLRDGLIFDFAGRSLTADRSGWKNAGPRVDDRSVKEAVQKIAQTKLKEIADVTAYALLPPQPRRPVPLLAIAYRDKVLQPWLSLYEPVSGEAVRQCTGHLDRIHSLAFSADGKLLASAADDQTVCVWSLTDLDQTLKLRGMLHGVAVLERGKDLVVARLDDKSLAVQNRGKLKEGDVLEGILDGEKLRPLTSAAEFYDTMWHTKPGGSVPLRIRGLQDTVRLRVGQGADERKPLFSLFFTRQPRPENWEWVGWSPVGYYESSDNNTERYVGWHFNTGKLDHPTSFALADQYHKQYYRKGLLQRLVEEGRLPKQEPEVQLPRPNMTLWVEEAGMNPEQVDGRVLVRQPRATLKLAINNFPLAKVASLKCRLDGGTPLDFAPASGEVQSLSLSWERGRHDLRVVLRTLEADTKTYEEHLAILYLPPPPEVTSKPARRQVVDKPDFHFRAEVRPALRGQDIAVRLLHKHREEVQEIDVNSGPEIHHDLQLRPGENLIELIARNKGAARPYEEFETTARVWSVLYRKKDPPLISLSSVVILTGTPATGRTLSFEPGKPAIVDAPKIRLEGLVKASEKLAEASATLDGAVPRPLVKFEPNKLREFTIQEELTLKPGLHKFRVRARTEAGGENETAVAIDYRPRLPKLVLTSPRAGTILYEGRDPREISLAGALGLPPDRSEFAAAILVNGEPTDCRPVVDLARLQLLARVPLQFGDNRIQVRLSNPWHVARLSEPILVRYLRPPRHIHFDRAQGMTSLTDSIGWPRWASLPGSLQVAEKPVADLVARLHSALPLTFVQAEVNGRRIAAEALAPTRPEDTTWTVRLKDVALVRGTNVVHVWASNDDGRSQEPGTLTIFYLPPSLPPPPPEVEILDPRRDITVGSASYTIEYRARSRTTLRRVELRRDGQVLHSVDMSALNKDAEGFVIAKGPTAVKLLPGANHLQVLAVNAGGQADATVTLSYVYKPVILSIDKLELRGQPSRFFPAEQKQNNRLLFSEVPASQLWLHGRVRWVDEGDERLKLRTNVWVWINGFKQMTELQPWTGQGLDRAFAVEIQLSQSKNNRVEIQLPDLPQELGKSHAFLVDCRQPVPKKQRLHLLIVGNGEQDSDKLRKRVLGALQATSLSNERFKTPAFEEAYLYDVLAGEHIDAEQVWPGLLRIKKRLFLRVSGDHASDVIMVYYRGSEADWFRLTYDNLASFFAGTPGAQVLLLDVTRDAVVRAAPLDPAPGQPSLGPADSHVGVLCYIWVNRGRPQTDDARLITDLTAALAKVGKVKEVISTLDDKFSRGAANSIWISNIYQQSLLYSRYFPEQLLDLSIGAKP